LDEFRGKQLPPRPHGLEAAFVNFGVSPKQKERARSAFDKSARAAGFFPNGNEDRLVEPFGGSSMVHSLVSSDMVLGAPVLGEPELASSLSPQPASGLHRSILGMLDELPAPKTQWGKSEQADWLEAVATLFQVIYKSDDKGEITVRFQPRLSDSGTNSE
ncbi:MAG: hypothetical protein M3N06_09295, partial [Pseudomonadota bacterium]|nr:hypothetical protein [Pseudomonadota bacterium]